MRISAAVNLLARAWMIGICLLGCDKVLAWTMTADFEKGSIGQKVNETSGFSADFVYSNTPANSGAKSAKASFSPSVTPGGYQPFPTHVGNSGEIWARGYFYFKSPWSWSCSPVVKIFRGAHIANSGGTNVGYLSIYADAAGKIQMSNEPGNYQDYSSTTSYDIDKWQCLEMYVKLSTTQPIFRIWKNGVLIKEDKITRTLGTSTDYADFSYVFTYWNGNPPQAQVSYVDDFMYTTSQPLATDSKGNRMIGPVGNATISIPMASRRAVGSGKTSVFDPLGRTIPASSLSHASPLVVGCYVAKIALRPYMHRTIILGTAPAGTIALLP